MPLEPPSKHKRPWEVEADPEAQEQPLSASSSYADERRRSYDIAASDPQLAQSSLSSAAQNTDSPGRDHFLDRYIKRSRGSTSEDRRTSTVQPSSAIPSDSITSISEQTHGSTGRPGPSQPHLPTPSKSIHDPSSTHQSDFSTSAPQQPPAGFQSSNDSWMHRSPPLSSSRASFPRQALATEGGRTQSEAAIEFQQLQQNHSQLWRELERTKVRLQAYDSKSKIADEELASLYEEKYALEDRVAILEQELAEVKQQRDEMRDLHAREGAQWRQLISLSDTLQKQHAQQSDQWKQERDELSDRIGCLEDKLRKMAVASVSGSTESGSQIGDEQHGKEEASGGAFLDREVQRMRLQEEKARTRLREYHEGNKQLKGLLGELLDTAKKVVQTIDDREPATPGSGDHTGS